MNKEKKEAPGLQKQILTFREALDYLDVSKSFLYKLTSSRKITFLKPNGGKIYFQKEELDKWILQNKFSSISDRHNELTSKIARNGK